MKKIVLGLVAIIIIGLVVAGILWSRKPQVIMLGNGTKLTLLGVTYGKHHVAPKVKIAGGGRARGGNARIDTTNDTLVVWIESEHKPNQWPNYDLLVYDTAETACASSSSRSQSQVKNGVDIQGFVLDAYPRWDSKMILRTRSWNGNQRVSKEQFVISNPARKSFPKWTADAVPDTQSDGDLDVTLTKFIYGVPGFNGGNSSSKDPMNKAVHVEFHTEQKGVVVTNWQPIQIATSDANGNQSALNSWSNNRDQGNGDASMTYQWGLWPAETPWKLRVEFSRNSGFNDDEIWVVTNVPVQPGSWQDLWNNGGRNNRNTNSVFAETTLNGVHLKIYPVIQITDQNFGNGQKQGGIRIGTDADLPEGFRLTATATDEQGRPLQNWGPNGGGNNYVVQFPNIRNSKSLNVTVALHKSRFVEFTATPAKP